MLFQIFWNTENCIAGAQAQEWESAFHDNTLNSLKEFCTFQHKTAIIPFSKILERECI